MRTLVPCPTCPGRMVPGHARCSYCRQGKSGSKPALGAELRAGNIAAYSEAAVKGRPIPYKVTR